MIDNQLRSVLFQVPRPGVPNPSVCLDGLPLPDCFSGVLDLGALDIERGRDHGMPSYNALRQAYGLAPKPSFTAITGEATDQFPNDPLIDAANPIDDPDILDFVALRDIHGHEIALGSDEARGGRRHRRAPDHARRPAARALRHRRQARRLHRHGLRAARARAREFGELQLAIWKRQFEALRDGDRFFYAGDPALALIERDYGISARRTLAQVIEANTGLDVRDDVFKTDGAPAYDGHDDGIGAHGVGHALARPRRAGELRRADARASRATTSRARRRT